MKQSNFQNLAWTSFFEIFKVEYVSKFKIIIPFLAALFFSAFILLEHLGIQNPVVHTFFALISYALILKFSKGHGFWFGFFVGIFWFWGISISFLYYDLYFLVPIVVLFFGVAYGFFFYFLDAYESPFYKASFLFLFSYLEPFGFNWLKPELLLVHSFFEVEKFYFAIILFSIASAIYFKKIWFLALLVIAIKFGIYPSYENDLNISMPQLKIPQNARWNETNKEQIVQTNLKYIDDAIKKKHGLIILPETAFSMVLNYEPNIFEQLRIKSFKIPIITGALFYDGKSLYNSTYFFKDGEYKVAHKMVLVPFGEAVPLPELAKNIVNGIFFGGAEDFVTAKEPTEFEIKRIKYTNAICYEATKDELYENEPKYMIAISNMAWFTPSTILDLQNLLLEYYSRKYKTKIYHSVNMGENRIFEPK